MINDSMENTREKENTYRLLTNIRNLPSLPSIILEVSKLLNNSQTSASDLGKIIGKDQGLVAKILTVANSPLYGLPRRVATVEFAIVILGFDHIKNIVMAISMIEAFKGKDKSNWDNKSYWNHTLFTATAAKGIADELGYSKSGEVFTAALLHDLGISVIQRYFNIEFNNICRLVDEQQMRFLIAEKKNLGITHQEVGKFLIDRWNLPESLGEAIANHHQPSKAENNIKLSSIIHLADYMTQRIGAGCFYWDENMQFDENIIDILKFGDEARLNDFIEAHEQIFKEQSSELIYL
jgi:putative nucleotidyltransferase with HDIG domain